jgi:hypothetical protein
MRQTANFGAIARRRTAVAAGSTLMIVAALAAFLPSRALAACLNSAPTNGNICITAFRTEPIGGNTQEMTATASYQSTVVTITQWNVVFSSTGPGGRVSGSQITQTSSSQTESAQQNVPYKPGSAGPPYQVAVQICYNSPIQLPLTSGLAGCSDWATASFSPPPPPTGKCPKGQVAKNGGCVTPPPPPCLKGQVVKNGECVTPPPPPPPSSGQSGSGGGAVKGNTLLKSNKAPQ